MKEFNELVGLCKGEVSIIINEHKSSYCTISEYFDRLYNLGSVDDDDLQHLAKMIERDIMINVRAYPLTPIGFYEVYHYDVEEAIKRVLEYVKENYNGNKNN